MNHYKLYKTLIILSLFFLAGCDREEIYLERADTEEAAEQEEISEELHTQEAETETDTGFCYVYVCGAVEKAGVYLLPSGSRVYEAIEMAGGLTAEAAAEALNQAETVCDGQMINVLTAEELAAEEIQAQSSDTAQEAEKDGKVNINTATAEVLMTLSGVGEAKAQSIIAYREANGFFADIESIKNVEGIKDGVYNQIKDKITVD